MNNCNECIFGDNVSDANERLAKMETKVDHVESDVKEMKSDVKNMERSLATLAAIAESNQKMEPRVKALEEKVTRWGGGIAVFIAVLTFFGDKVKGLFG